MIKINRSEKSKTSKEVKAFETKAKNGLAQAKTVHAKQIQALLHELENFESNNQTVKHLKKPGQTIAIVGIGGSSLGLQVIQEYFAIKNVVYFENIDPLDFESQIKDIPFENTVWIFISKSGETIETLATLELIQQFSKEKNLPFLKQSVVITENKKSTLSDWAKTYEVVQIELPIDVGGRYSILSSVGLVPSYFWGLELKGFCNGAKLALEDETAIVNLVTESLQSFSRDELITVLWSYSSRYKKLGFWWQQLWAESLSKRTTRSGTPAPYASTPLPLVGATDQHSVLQQVMEGQKDKFVIFMRNAASETGSMNLRSPLTNVCQTLKGKNLGVLLAAEATATQQSLDAVHVSNMTIQVQNHSEASLGYLFMFFQLVVLALGESLQINPVDQPGVELGKKLCKELLGKSV